MTTPTNLFLPRLRAWSVSAAVGSGKTRAACAWMAGPETARRNVLYVAPTKRLLNQTRENLVKAIAASTGTVRNVNLVSSETTSAVTVEARIAIAETDSYEGRVLFLTTPTFIALVPHIKHPDLWSVICDEAFEPATFAQFGLGKDVARGWQHFSELFAVQPEESGYRIVPAEGKRSLVDEVAKGDLRNAGDRFASLQAVAAAAANPAIRAELVVTAGAEKLVRGDVPAPAELEADEDEKGSGYVLQFSSYVDPSAFCGFREVLFLSALFEQTILYKLWTKGLGVTFASHPDFPVDLLEDTHAREGKYLAVGHLLHEDDSASLVNLRRDSVTGAHSESPSGAPSSIVGRTRVIDRMVQTSAAHFGGERFLLQSNDRFGYGPDAMSLPGNAVFIPPIAHGRNDFDHVDNVAALFVRNPNNQQRAWVQKRTGMTAAEVNHAFRIHSVYQALGRCSIRKAAATGSAKVLLTAGSADARFIADLFPGSHWLGQVGTLPALSTLVVKDSEPGKIDRIASTIQVVLAGLDMGSIKGTELRARVEAHLAAEMFPSSPNTYGEDGRNESITRTSWSTALARATAQGCGWRKEGYSVVQVTAATYGFTRQADAD